jgi:cell division transport system permease protein
MGIVLRNAGKNIRRSPYQSIAATLLLIVTLFVAQVFFLVAYGFNEILGYFETQPQVTAFFTNEASASAILAVKQELEQQTFVESVRYVSKEEALGIYREQNKEDPLLLEMVSAEILPASLEVSARSIDALPLIRQRISESPNIEEVAYQQDVVEKLEKWSRAIQLIGLSVVTLLTFASVLVLIVIISLKVASKRHEIATMRLLGASSWYIRGPFIIEGSFYGFVGAFIAWLILMAAMMYGKEIILAFLDTIPSTFTQVDTLAIIGLLAMLVGSFLGMLASLVAVRRYYR